jgi:hypothetical protein
MIFRERARKSWEARARWSSVTRLAQYHQALFARVRALGAEPSFFSARNEDTGFALYVSVEGFTSSAFIERFKTPAGMTFYASAAGDMQLLWGRSTQSVLEVVVEKLKLRASRVLLASMEGML